MHVLYIELSMRLLFREVAPARPGMGALQFGIRALLKLKLFMWLVFKEKTLTWDTLQRRGWIGLGRCSLCNLESETISHLFVDSRFVHSLSRELLDHYKITTHWEG
jgi:hypothetical protein